MKKPGDKNKTPSKPVKAPDATKNDWPDLPEKHIRHALMNRGAYSAREANALEAEYGSDGIEIKGYNGNGKPCTGR